MVKPRWIVRNQRREPLSPAGVVRHMLEPMDEKYDDESLLVGFESAEILPGEWTHRAHVRAGYCYCSRFPFADAIRKTRAGLQNLNQKFGTPNLPRRGYHETITIAYLTIINCLIARDGVAVDSLAFCNRYPKLLQKDLLLDFYSPETLWHPLAKVSFVEPDRMPIDTQMFATDFHQ